MNYNIIICKAGLAIVWILGHVISAVLLYDGKVIMFGCIQVEEKKNKKTKKILCFSCKVAIYCHRH